MTKLNQNFQNLLSPAVMAFELLHHEELINIYNSNYFSEIKTKDELTYPEFVFEMFIEYEPQESNVAQVAA